MALNRIFHRARGYVQNIWMRVPMNDFKYGFVLGLWLGAMVATALCVHLLME